MNYWKSREIQTREHLLDNSIAQVENQLLKEYKRSSDKISKEMLTIYEELLNKDGKINISDIYKFNRYYELIGNIQTELTRLGNKEDKILNKGLKDLYINNQRVLEKFHRFPTVTNTLAAENVIKEIWCADGKSWSERIWTNKSNLTNTLTDGLFDIISSGTGKDELERTLMKTFNSSFYQAQRLTRTELSHIYNQSTIDKYKEAGIKQYRFLTAHDERLCEECGALDGQVFSISEQITGENFPPIHPNCRCTILAVE